MVFGGIIKCSGQVVRGRYSVGENRSHLSVLSGSRSKLKHGFFLPLWQAAQEEFGDIMGISGIGDHLLDEESTFS